MNQLGSCVTKVPMPWPRTLRSRFPVAFGVASATGAVGGLLHEGGSALGSADLQAILLVVCAGGVVGGFCSGRTFHERSWLMVPFLVLAGLTAPLTAAYAGLRGSIFVVELAIPMALAFVPFAFVYGYVVVLLGEASSPRDRAH